METRCRVYFFTVAFVGFEQPSYTVNENDGTAEMCINLRNPPSRLQLLLSLETTGVTAGIQVLTINKTHIFTCHFLLDNSDFRPLMGSTIGSAVFVAGSTNNRTCSRIELLEDDFYENRESLNVTIGLGEGVTRVVIDPPVTEVFIIDVDGNL